MDCVRYLYVDSSFGFWKPFILLATIEVNPIRLKTREIVIGLAGYVLFRFLQIVNCTRCLRLHFEGSQPLTLLFH